MYPGQMLSLFPPFPRDRRVFVAMSFDVRFDARWNEVIRPAIASVSYEGAPLEPFRVDSRRVAESVLSDIVTGIANCRMVFADVTTLHVLNGIAIRPANVFYEIGIAHVARLQEEVVLFRSDNDALPFDIANVRVNSYDPSGDADAARWQVHEAIKDALREIDLRTHLSVASSVASLDGESLDVLMNAATGLTHPPMRTMRNALGSASRINAIMRLLDRGLLESRIPRIPAHHIAEVQDVPIKEMVIYVLSPLGRIVLTRAMEAFGLHDAAAQGALLTQEGAPTGGDA